MRRLFSGSSYVEEELEILRRGENGQYGLLRRLDSGKNATARYAINFILFDRKEIGKIRAAYTEQIPAVCNILSRYVEEHKEEYMAFPYLNRRIDWNLVLWQQVQQLEHTFGWCVVGILSQKYFAQVKKEERPFHVYGYVDDGGSTGAEGCWMVVEK